jgi:hypothetical protein
MAAPNYHAGHASGVMSGPRKGAAGHGHLDVFLTATGVKVLDMMRGAAPGTRRLLLGQPGASQADYAVAVVDRKSSESAIEAEVRTLDELQACAAPTFGETLPRVVAPLSIGDQPAMVMRAVPGQDLESHRTFGPPSRVDLDAVSSWLGTLWLSTGGRSEPAELGGRAADLLLARYCGSRHLAATLGAIHRARGRLSGVEVRRTAVHGCLCPHHVYVRDGVVTGVDDWGLGAPVGEPLRDLGSFAIRHSRGRLPDIVADRSRHARLVRDFVRAGLDAIGVPVDWWRDVLVLAQAEYAVDALERGQVEEIRLLAAAVNALPSEPGESEAARP